MHMKPLLEARQAMLLFAQYQPFLELRHRQLFEEAEGLIMKGNAAGATLLTRRAGAVHDQLALVQKAQTAANPYDQETRRRSGV